MKAAIYCRVSTKDQQVDGTSLDSQLEACKRFAYERGYTLSEEYIIREVYSGLTLERPDLSRVRRWLDSHEIDAVVIYDTDRFSRDGYDFLTLLRACKNAGVELLCVLEPIEHSEIGELISFVRGWGSRREAEKIKERAIRGRKERARGGKLPSGGHARLFGYIYIPGKGEGQGIRQINEGEARWVRKIFNWLVTEGLSTGAIAYRLRDLNVPTASGKGPWYRATVCKVLKNPAYCGKTYAFTHRYRKPLPEDEWIEIPGATPAIVSREIFEEAQKRLRENSKLSKRSVKKPYMLRGHIRCRRCGRSYYGELGTGYKGHYYLYYQCAGNLKKITPIKCGNKRYNAAYLDRVVWEQVENLLSQPELVLAELIKREKEEQDNTSVWQREIETIDIQLSNREIQRARIWKAFELTGDESRFKKDVASMDREVESLQDERINIAKRIEQNKNAIHSNDLKEACSLISSNLRNLTLEDKQFALRALQIQVWIDGDKVEIQGVIPIDVCGSATPLSR